MHSSLQVQPFAHLHMQYMHVVLHLLSLTHYIFLTLEIYHETNILNASYFTHILHTCAESLQYGSEYGLGAVCVCDCHPFQPIW